jgi:5-methylcytosine-specific restriction endonuclease McrA
VRNKATVLNYYDIKLRAGHGKNYPLPAVIILKKYVRQNYLHVGISKRKIYVRDKYECQYCGERLKQDGLTIDHIIPKSFFKKGPQVAVDGKQLVNSGSWRNLITSCKPCNTKKGNRTPEQAGMNLLTLPRIPDRIEIKLGLLSESFPDEWRNYIAV